jgi:DNA-binding protein HU-beta
MNKIHLAEVLAKKLGIPKIEALEFVEAFADTVMELVASGESIRISGFGEFFPKERHSRRGLHPQDTSKWITMPATRVGKFRAGKRFKDAMKASIIAAHALKEE